MANEDLLRTYKNRKASEGQFAELAGLTPGTPQYKQKVEEHMQFNRINSIDNPKMISEYGNEFNLADIQVSPETIQTALGEGVDPTNPDNFTTEAYNTAIKNISNTLGTQWTGVRDKSKLDAKAKALLDKSQWGQNFARTIKFEAGRTTQQDRLQAHSADIGAAINLKDPELVDTRINNFLTFARENNITGDDLKPFDEVIQIGLERAAIDPVALFESVNPNSNYVRTKGLTKEITPNEAKKLENKLKELYREKYPNLSDRYLLPKIQQDFKKDGNLAFAIQRGKDMVKYQSSLEADEMKRSREFKGLQTQALLDMKRVGTRKYITDKLHDKLSKFMDPDGAAYGKIIRQSEIVIQRMRGFFTHKEGPNKGVFALAGTPGEEAFNLAVNRAILGGAALRKDFWTPSDLILPAASISEDADKLSEQSLMKVFVDSIPDSSASLSTLKIDDKSTNVKEGIKDLKELAKLAQTQVNKGTFNKWNLYEAWDKIWRD
jgi:hypothetical protein